VLDKIPESVIARAAYVLTTPWGIASLFVGLLIFFVVSLSTVSVFSGSYLLFAIAALAAAIFTAVVNNLIHPPKFKTDEVGLLLAIRADSREAQDRIDNDITTALIDSLRETNSSIPFNVQVLQQFHARNVVTNDAAIYYAGRTKARFALYGTLTKRKNKAEDHFVLHVEALATHAPTTQENQNTLANEMKAILPLKANIAAKNELEGLELTGRLFGLGAQYVMGVVLFLSGDTKASIRALDALSKKLKTLSASHKWLGAKQLNALAPKRLLDFQYSEIDAHYFQWRSDHDPARLQEIEAIFTQLPDQWKKDPRYLGVRAVCHFVLHKNIPAAQDLLKKIGALDANVPTWRYSLAFLDAYENNISSAKSQYMQAFRSDGTTDISLEIEEFLLWIYETDKSKVQMLFFLGLINFHKKRDFASAARDLEAFIKSNNSTHHPDLDREARQMIQKCKEIGS
jgi:hypothetical protein